MKLAPSRPPGRSNRKARAFASDIQELRADGYTFSAIQEALAGAGVNVSLKTVQREVARARRQRPLHVTPHALVRHVDAHGGDALSTPAQPAEVNAARKTGREVAEEFVRLNPCNPLLKTKESP